MKDDDTNLGKDRLALLQTFVRIVDAGSLSAAATQLGVTQPTISRRLQSLERLLGLRLLQRSTHAMKLTEDGERCFEHARGMVERWQAIEADLQGAADTPRGLLRVLAPSAFGQEQLIAPLANYLRRHPQVSVEWLLNDRLPDFVAEGIDCAVRVGPVDEPGLVAIHLADLPRLVVAAPTLLGEGAPPATPDDLRDLPWLAQHHFYREEVALTRRDDGRQVRFAIRPRLITDSLHALRNAALAGVGVTILSAWVAADDLSAGRLVRLVPQWVAPTLPIHLVHAPLRFPPARLRRFIELMREHMPRLVEVTPVVRR